MKTFRILFFIAISTFLLSCHYDTFSPPINDTDGDGISDTLNLVDNVYELRETYNIQDNIIEYTSRMRSPRWYKPIKLPYVTYSSIQKNGIKYVSLDEYINTAVIYQIEEDTTTPANVDKYVFITLEPVPIFKEDMVILLVSKTTYIKKADAIAAAKAVDIPKIKMNISHLDLVFDPTVPESDYLSYENVAENVEAIQANYNLLEFFGTSYSYKEKEKLLRDYGYNTLFE